jgi:hypothetical protein
VPTLLIVDGFRFHFFSREGGEPPHVHVRKGDAVAKFWLQPVRLDFSEGFNPSELRRIRELTFEHQAEFLERWNEYFAR